MSTGLFLRRAIALGLLVFGAVLVLTPFFWMLSLSFKSQSEIFTPHLRLFSRKRFAGRTTSPPSSGRPCCAFLFNGLVVCAGILFFPDPVSPCPAAYALAQRTFRARSLIFGLVLAGLLVPFHVTAIPHLPRPGGDAAAQHLHRAHPSVRGFGVRHLPLPSGDRCRCRANSSRPHGSMACRRRRSPGASPFRSPCRRPPLFAIFSVVAHWNDLFWPLIAITDSSLAPPPARHPLLPRRGVRHRCRSADGSCRRGRRADDRRLPCLPSAVSSRVSPSAGLKG